MSSDPKTPNIKDLMQSSALAGLLEKARGTQSLEAQLRNALPEYADAPWSLGRVDKDSMVVVTTSAAWATRMRFDAGSWLDAAARLRDCERPRAFDVRVRPPTPGR